MSEQGRGSGGGLGCAGMLIICLFVSWASTNILRGVQRQIVTMVPDLRELARSAGL